MGDVWNFDLGDEAELEESDGQGNVAGRDCVVCVVDASQSMRDTLTQEGDRSLFQLAMEVSFTLFHYFLSSGP